VWALSGAAYWPAQLLRCAKGSQETALVELFGTGLKTEVSASGLTAFTDGCDDKCIQLHSDLGQQVGGQVFKCQIVHSHTWGLP